MVFKILLVEDDPEIREIIIDYFTQKSSGTLDMDLAATGLEGQLKSTNNDYDLLLLDIMLPELDGFTICRELRKTSDVPIIFLTAKQDERDILHGYNLGCDDYVTKPFSLAELYAKSMALLKRSKGMIGKEIMTAGRIKLDPYRFRTYVDDEEIVLAPIEFAILKALMENQGRVLSRDVLLTRIWGYDFDGNERVVDNHVKKLRKALGDAAIHIETVFKKGYKMEV